ncbi:monooxygenase FAD-binding protein [Vulcanisaeta moutnovskia 768-28]|uniref:Monooxygenase FAD-binding protein n=1 Tax=Vulcanisaeta moutnovskia (strain 768-28) TaxID=985053 RepID=F0QSQ0_VULM7|nr:FAD-dependent oxidoreductase [Vulcanisaeta moutnovskia]ADY01567.1 monooxygenase FAD-binding protein [Vulcanisaeta moutnovskia 768-28]
MVGYTVIGAGLAGLSLALELRRLGVDIEVIEYRDYAGGIHALIPEVRGVINDALNEVNIRLITTAIKIDSTVYEVWRGGYRRLSDNALVATGFRVMTMPELGIYGERPAGIYPHHAVLDMLHYDLLPGKNVIIYGDNTYAISLARELMRRGATAHVVSPTKLNVRTASGDVEVIIGKVRYVKGLGRVERVLVNNEWVIADTLVISVFKPFNPFPEFRAVGQSAIEIYDPSIVIESGKIMARELMSKSNEFITINSDLPIYPGNRVSRDIRRVIIPCGGCRVMINDREYVINGDAAVIELPDVERVSIRRVVS